MVHWTIDRIIVATLSSALMQLTTVELSVSGRCTLSHHTRLDGNFFNVNRVVPDLRLFVNITFPTNGNTSSAILVGSWQCLIDVAAMTVLIVAASGTGCSLPRQHDSYVTLVPGGP